MQRHSDLAEKVLWEGDGAFSTRFLLPRDRVLSTVCAGSMEGEEENSIVAEVDQQDLICQSEEVEQPTRSIGRAWLVRKLAPRRLILRSNIVPDVCKGKESLQEDTIPQQQYRIGKSKDVPKSRRKQVAKLKHDDSDKNTWIGESSKQFDRRNNALQTRDSVRTTRHQMDGKCLLVKQNAKVFNRSSAAEDCLSIAGSDEHEEDIRDIRDALQNVNIVRQISCITWECLNDETHQDDSNVHERENMILLLPPWEHDNHEELDSDASIDLQNPLSPVNEQLSQHNRALIDVCGLSPLSDGDRKHSPQFTRTSFLEDTAVQMAASAPELHCASLSSPDFDESVDSAVERMASNPDMYLSSPSLLNEFSPRRPDRTSRSRSTSYFPPNPLIERKPANLDERASTYPQIWKSNPSEIPTSASPLLPYSKRNIYFQGPEVSNAGSSNRKTVEGPSDKSEISCADILQDLVTGTHNGEQHNGKFELSSMLNNLHSEQSKEGLLGVDQPLDNRNKQSYEAKHSCQEENIISRPNPMKARAKTDPARRTYDDESADPTDLLRSASYSHEQIEFLSGKDQWFEDVFDTSSSLSLGVPSKTKETDETCLVEI